MFPSSVFSREESGFLVLVTLSDGRQVIDPGYLKKPLEDKFVEVCRVARPNSVVENPRGVLTINIRERPKVPDVAAVDVAAVAADTDSTDTTAPTPPKKRRQRRHKAASHRK